MKINYKKYKYVLLLLIPLIVCFGLRAYTLTLPITDNWAEQTIENNIKYNIAEEIFFGRKSSETDIKKAAEKFFAEWLKLSADGFDGAFDVQEKWRQHRSQL